MAEQRTMAEDDDLEGERRRQAAFLSKHKDFYDGVLKVLADSIDRGDLAELGLHVSYLGKLIEEGLNLALRLREQRHEQGQGFKGVTFN